MFSVALKQTASASNILAELIQSSVSDVSNVDDSNGTANFKLNSPVINEDDVEEQTSNKQVTDETNSNVEPKELIIGEFVDNNDSSDATAKKDVAQKDDDGFNWTQF